MNLRLLLLSGALLLPPAAVSAQSVQPIAPDRFFKQPIGSDYYLANYTEYEAYLKRLASESDRIKLVDIGKSAEGRTQWMAVVSSPANLQRLEDHRATAEKLARGRVPEAEARRLAREDKAVVWIDAGLHASETVTSQGQIQVLYRTLSQSDPETLRLLDDCIILFAHDNPDGMEMASNWYTRQNDPNSIGLLTEIIGGPTPTRIPLLPSTQLPRGDELMPISPREWHLQDSLDYQWTLDRAVIDYASRNRERLLFNFWRMGANSIAKGSTDSWTMTPAKVERMENAAPLRADGPDEYNRPATGPKRIDPALYKTLAQVPAERDPRAYVIPANQRDIPTAITFLNALIKNGVELEP